MPHGRSRPAPPHEPLFFKMGPLVVRAKRLGGGSDLHRVSVMGRGEQFDVVVRAGDETEAAVQVVEDLAFAAHHPARFLGQMAERARTAPSRLAAERVESSARAAVDFAAVMREDLVSAVLAVDAGRAKRLGAGPS